MLRSISASLLMAVTALPAAAGEFALPSFDLWSHAWRDGARSHVVDIDNDSLLLRRDDGLYTSGVRYTGLSSLNRAHGSMQAGWRIGQDIYTASEAEWTPQQIPAGDHPYAAWLYAGVFTRQENADGSSLATGIDLGCLGPCAAGRPVQRGLHRLLRQNLPQGWDTQLDNEAGVLAHAAWTPARWALAPRVDLAPTLAARFGNIHTDASAGFLLRAGDLGRAPGAWHGYLRMEARAVGWNATLQGGYFSDEAHPRAVQPRRLTGEAELGVRWQGRELGVAAGIVHRASEVRTLPGSQGAQNFARFQFVYTP